jgi:hypothetical protein
MTDILRLLLIIFMLAVSLSSYFLVVGVFFPNRIDKTRRAIEQWIARSFGVGLVNFLFFGAIAFILLMLTNGDNRVDDWLRVILIPPTIVVWGFIAVLLTFGLSAVVNMLGEKLFPEQAKIKQILFGGTVLTFACALPFAGWFLLLPFVGFMGIGGTILGFFQRKSD